jgi:hypothetical protein
MKLPWLLAQNATAAKTPVTVLDHRAFFYPLWDDVYACLVLLVPNHANIDRPATPSGLRWVHGTLPHSRTQSPSPSPSEDPSSPLATDFLELALDDTATAADDPEAVQHGPLAPDVPGWSFAASGQYTYHLWYSLLRRRIFRATRGALQDERAIDLQDVLERDSSFNRQARRWLDDGLVQDWRHWHAWRSKQGKMYVGKNADE